MKSTLNTGKTLRHPYSLLILFAFPLVILTYVLERTEFLPLILCYGSLFLLYGGILWATRQEKQIKVFIGAAVVFRLIILFAVPNLSDDFYRFLWDGNLLAGGENPFLHLPQWYIDHPEAVVPGIDKFLFYKLNSQQYFTVYPPLLQASFWIASALAQDYFLIHVVLLKTFIFLAEVGSILFLIQLVKRFKLPANSVLVYALNPLVIVELSNLHFEAFMIFFLLGAVYFLASEKWLPSAVMFGCAVGAKIIPVMFLPFLIRRLGWKKSLGYFAVVGGVAMILFWPILNPEALLNFVASLKLYFAKFEYNASFYYFIRGVIGGWSNRILGVLFPVIVFFSIMRMAQKEITLTWITFAEHILFSITLYYLLATTVHPWYLTTFIAFAALTGYRYPLVWSGMITLTYVTYIVPGQYVEQNWIIFLEYLTVFAFLFYEVVLKRKGLTLEEWILNQPTLRSWVEKTIPGRVKIKLDRIHRHIQPEERVLDIGIGNGGLAHAMQKRGVDLTPLDVKNISFFDDIQPIVYDGITLPFENDAFDKALLTTVLHHIPDPVATLDEAIRVAPRLIVMEDIYYNPIQKYLTFFMDSLVNFEFEGHPHTNKTDEEWREIFKEKGLRVVEAEYIRTLVLFRQVIYVLERA